MTAEKDMQTFILFGLRKPTLEEVLEECSWLQDQLGQIPLEHEQISYRIVQATDIGQYRVLEYQAWHTLTEQERASFDKEGKPLSCVVYAMQERKLVEISRGSY